MTWQNILNILIFILVFRVIFYFIDKSTQKKRGDQEKMGTLHMHAAYTYFGLFMIPAGLMFLFTAIGNIQEDQAWIVALMGLTFIVFGLYVIAFGRNHKVYFTESQATIRNWRGKKVTFEWSEVQHIHYARTKGKFLFQLNEATVGCHFHLKGITNFLRVAQDKTNLEVQF